MKKNHFFSLFLSLAILMALTLPVSAQTSARDYFTSAPDSVFPYLSENNRLDLIDFIDAKMEATVTNLLDGHTTMTSLGDDSLTLRLSPSASVVMLVLPVEEAVDSAMQVICLVTTYTFEAGYTENGLKFYSAHWRLLDAAPPLTADGRLRIQRHSSETIRRWDEDKLCGASDLVKYN